MMLYRQQIDGFFPRGIENQKISGDVLAQRRCVCSHARRELLNALTCFHGMRVARQKRAADFRVVFEGGDEVPGEIIQ